MVREKGQARFTTHNDNIDLWSNGIIVMIHFVLDSIYCIIIDGYNNIDLWSKGPIWFTLFGQNIVGVYVVLFIIDGYLILML